jgi:nucleoid-associated protein YgaU
VWCSGKVPSLYLKDLASATARSVGGVQSVDTLALEVTHSYATRPGDILSRVAVRVYGDATRWRQIRSANKEKIENPDALSPGVVLTIP